MDLARNLIQRINVGDSLTRSAAARPAQPAVVDGPRRWSYAEFNGWVNQLAHGLAARGCARGDALGLASGNSAEFLAVYFACAKLGLVCVPVNLGWRSEEVAYVLDHSGARGLVVEAQLVEQLREAIVKVAAIADVIVAPGTGAEYRPSPPTGPGPRWPGWPRRRAPGPSRSLRRRPGPAQLSVHLRHHLVPQGRGGQPRGHLPGVDGQRAGLAVEPHRPVRGHDADVPHRAAERVLHARRSWSARPFTCCAVSIRRRC